MLSVRLRISFKDDSVLFKKVIFEYLFRWKFVLGDLNPQKVRTVSISNTPQQCFQVLTRRHSFVSIFVPEIVEMVSFSSHSTLAHPARWRSSERALYKFSICYYYCYYWLGGVMVRTLDL